MLLVVFQMGGGVQAVAQTLVPRRVACSAVISPGALAIGIALPSTGSEPSSWMSSGNPMMVRSRLSPIPFLASNSWSATSLVMVSPKNAEEAPNPSIVCLVSDQRIVTSRCSDDPHATRLAQTLSASAIG